MKTLMLRNIDRIDITKAGQINISVNDVLVLEMSRPEARALLSQLAQMLESADLASRSIDLDGNIGRLCVMVDNVEQVVERAMFDVVSIAVNTPSFMTDPHRKGKVEVAIAAMKQAGRW